MPRPTRRADAYMSCEAAGGRWPVAAVCCFSADFSVRFAFGGLFCGAELFDAAQSDDAVAVRATPPQHWSPHKSVAAHSYTMPSMQLQADPAATIPTHVVRACATKQRTYIATDVHRTTLSMLRVHTADVYACVPHSDGQVYHHSTHATIAIVSEYYHARACARLLMCL